MPNEVKAQNTIDLTSLKELSDAVDNTSEYFWHTETDTGAGAGAHITQIPQADFLDEPANGGGNTLIDSNGLTIRDGLTELSSFRRNKTVIGRSDEPHIEVSPLGLLGVNSEGSPSFGIRLSGVERTETVSVGTAKDFLFTFVEEANVRVAIGQVITKVPFKGIFYGDFGKSILQEGSGVYDYFTSITTVDNCTATITEGEIHVTLPSMGTFNYGTEKTVEWSVSGNYVSESKTGTSSYYYTLYYNGSDTVTIAVEGINSRSDWLNCIIGAQSFEGEATMVPSHVCIGTDDGERGPFSATFGIGLQAPREGQLSIGRYNNNDNVDLFEIGNGTDGANRKTVFAIDESGRICVNDSIDNRYVLIGYNGVNLWIGADQTNGYHHEGGTYISSGIDPNSIDYGGYKSIKISVPSAGGATASNYDVLHTGYEPDNATPAITASTGTVSNAAIYRFGRVIHFAATFSKTTATAAGSNLFEGTMPAAYRPLARVTGVGYVGSSAAVLQMTTGGAMVVRATGAQIAANANVYISATYLI